MEKIAEILHLAYRQSWAIETGMNAVKNSFRCGAGRSFLASLLLLFQMINYVLFQIPMPATGQKLDLKGYRLVFSDEFDGDTLDTEAWKYRIQGARRDGFDCASQTTVQDGNLIITAEYREDGAYGPGWYTGNISLREKYCRGYFEIRCKVSDGGDFWSAFWIQADHPYDHDISAGGPGGAEIDIFEAMNGSERSARKRNGVTTTIHCNGSDDDREKIDSRQLGTFRAPDIYNKFNTYGLEWTEDEYIFYINGVETARSSFANGVSQVPEEVIVSLESPDQIKKPHDFNTRFVVDYVKIFQKAG